MSSALKVIGERLGDDYRDSLVLWRARIRAFRKILFESYSSFYRGKFENVT